MKHTKLKTVVDGDVLLYRTAHKAMKDNANIKITFDSIFDELKNNIQSDIYELHISGGDNFRKKIAPNIVDYKGKRKEKPVQYFEVRDYIVATYNPVCVKGYEADDTAAMECHAQQKKGNLIMFATIDKDWKQIPGLFYNMQYKNLTVLSTEERIKFLHLQLLTGDLTDNVQGLQGIGPVKANKLLANKDILQQFSEIIKAYRQAHPSNYVEVLNTMGAMLYLVKDKKDPIWNIDWWQSKLKEYHETKNPSCI